MRSPFHGAHDVFSGCCRTSQFYRGCKRHQQQDDANFQPELRVMEAATKRLGEDIAAMGHDLVACSAFRGSADFGAIQGASKVLRNSRGPTPAIEVHCPLAPNVLSALSELTGNRRIPISVSSPTLFRRSLRDRRTGNTLGCFHSWQHWI